METQKLMQIFNKMPKEFDKSELKNLADKAHKKANVDYYVIVVIYIEEKMK